MRGARPLRRAAGVGAFPQSILGTLFERGRDSGKRARLGAHYTDRDKVMLLVEPVVSARC